MTPQHDPVTILTVDDNEATRYMVARMLRRAGFDVREATTGQEALRLTTEAPAAAPDLVILDVRLPDVNGMEVCRRIKQNPATSTLPVLHLSASYTKGEDKAHGLDGGADGYLTHPVEAPELIATVNALLRARRAEERANAAAQQWQATFDAISDGVCLVDRAGRVVRCNGALGALVGTGCEETAQRDLVGLLERGVGPLDGEALRRAWRTAHGETQELRIGDRWFRVTTSPVAGARGEDGGSVCVFADVTERHRTEDGQRFLSEAGGVLASSLDFHTTLASVARLAVPVLGDLCVIDVVEEGGEVRRVEVVHDVPEKERQIEALRRSPPHASAPDNPLLQVLRTGRPLLLADVAAPILAAARDAEHAQALREIAARSMMLVPIVARGRTLGAVSFASLRGRRYTAADLAFAEELVRRAAFAVDNARLYEQALVASQAKGDFLAVMSHELRTPLNAIIGYAELLAMGIPGPVTGEQTAHLERIKLSGRHLLALIDEVLTFSRIEAGKEEALVEPTDAGSLAWEAASLVEPLTSAKGLRFDVAVPSEGAPLALATDPRKLRQILLNLLSNAVKFTDAGSVALRVRAEGGPSGVVVFEVADTGIGIPAEHLEHIFDPFWQVEQKATRRVGGTGLGLSVVRRLAELLGGDVSVRSEAERGSTFTVRVPRVARPAATAPARATNGATNGAAAVVPAALLNAAAAAAR